MPVPRYAGMGSQPAPMANWSGGLQGALSGGASGAALGSIFPGIGNIAGGLGGAAIGGLAGLFSGSPESFEEYSPFTQEQHSALSELLGLGQQGLNGQGDLNPIQQQMMQRFQTQIVPSIAERFGNLGGAAGSNRGSSALLGQLGSAGSQLATDLGAQQFQQSQDFLNMGLRPRYEQYRRPAQSGFGEELTSQLPGILLKLAEMYKR